MIMNRKTYHSLRTLFAAGALLLTAACSNDETDDFYAAHPDAVRFGVTIGTTPATRVNTEGDGTTFIAGDRIGISADGGTSYTTYELPAEGSEWTPANGARYLKWKEQTLSFKAYYPVTEGTSYSSFQIPSTQRNLEQLRKADYMLAEATDQTTGAAVPLTFKHQLAKVTFVLTPGDEAEGETFSSIFIRSYGTAIENGTTTGGYYSIGPYKKEENTFIAILPPQAGKPDWPFIELRVAGASSKEYNLLGIPKLDKGKAYTLNLQVGHDGVKLGGITVEEWNTQDMNKGEAEYQAPTLWDGTTTSQPAGYVANSPGEVEITSAPELAWLAQQNNAFEGYTFRLTADIDLNLHEWKPISSSYPFKGTFDGQNHTVSNLKCTTSRFAGLFGNLNGAVKGVTVSGSVSFALTDNSGFLGGIAGYVVSSTITGCTNQCTVSATGNNEYPGFVGGIAGCVVEVDDGSTSTLTDNTNTGNVSTNGYSASCAGGIIGNATSAASGSSITLTGNTYDGGTPSDVCIGKCIFNNGGTITIDAKNDATDGKPYPVPQQP